MHPDEGVQKKRALDKSVVFEALDEQSKEKMLAVAQVKRISAGEMIFHQGSPGRQMIAIAEGTVRISRSTSKSREVILADLHVGEVFGEIALLDGGERSADARALTNCTLVILERRSLIEILQRNPEQYLRIIHLLCQRIRRSDERMVEVAFLDLPVRMARALLRLTPSNSQISPTTPMRLSLSQGELAGMIGSSRENVNRCLRKWQQANIVNIKDGWLIVMDPGQLAAIAESQY